MEDDDTEFGTASSEGTPLIAIPADLASLWSTADTERAIDAGDRVTVAGYVETGRVTVGSGHALVLDGEMDTAFVPISGGGVLVRGGSFDDAESAAGVVADATAKSAGWQPYPHALEVTGGALWIFDSAWPAPADPDAFEGDFGLVVAPLEPGSYAIDIRGDDSESGPIVFIRLQRR